MLVLRSQVLPGATGVRNGGTARMFLDIARTLLRSRVWSDASPNVFRIGLSVVVLVTFDI